MTKLGSFALRDRPDCAIAETMKHPDAFAALPGLAQGSLLSILRLLVTTGLTVGRLVEQCEMPAPTRSFHLKALAAGLIEATQENRFVSCHVVMSRISALFGS